MYILIHLNRQLLSRPKHMYTVQQFPRDNHLGYIKEKTTGTIKTTPWIYNVNINENLNEVSHFIMQHEFGPKCCNVSIIKTQPPTEN